METLTRPAIAGRMRIAGWRPVAYWTATAGAAAELAVGGCWDVLRIPAVLHIVVHLGYPSYFLVLLGTWKMLAAIALLVPGRPLLKEWAYAGAFFVYTGAIVSHLTTRFALIELVPLTILLALTIASWALRPASRRVPRAAAAASDPAVPAGAATAR